MSVRISAGGLWFTAEGADLHIERSAGRRIVHIGDSVWYDINLIVAPSDLPRWREAIDRAIAEGEANAAR